MLKAIIVDDEINGLRSLELLCVEFKEQLQIIGSTTSAIEAIDLINKQKPELVFMDISMPQLNGFELLEKLSFRHFYLVFTTAHKEYALRALKMGATDYLLKPIDVRELNLTLQKIRLNIADQVQRPDVLLLLKGLQQKYQLRVNLPTRNSVEFVTPDNIVFMEARSNHTLVMLTSGEQVESIKPLGVYEEQLCAKDLDFIRLHNSYIVNVNYITRYVKEDGGFVQMSGKKHIPISRQKKSRTAEDD